MVRGMSMPQQPRTPRLFRQHDSQLKKVRFWRKGAPEASQAFVIIEICLWRYRLGVRTEDSQSSNPGSIPGSATKPIL